MTSVNWGDLIAKAETAERAEKQLLPASKYDCVVKATTVKVSGGGKDMIQVVFEVEDGPYKGAPLFKYLVISPGSAIALGILLEQLGALGVSAEYFASNPQLEDVAEKIKGARATVGTKQKEYPLGSGTMDNEVTGISAPKGAAPAASSNPIADIPQAAPVANNTTASSSPVPF